MGIVNLKKFWLKDTLLYYILKSTI